MEKKSLWDIDYKKKFLVLEEQIQDKYGKIKKKKKVLKILKKINLWLSEKEYLKV